MRLHVVLRHTMAAVVHQPEIDLSAHITLFSILPVPLHSLGVVLRQAQTLVIHEPEVELRPGMALHDKHRKFVWVPKAIKRNLPESPNVWMPSPV